MTLDPSLPQSFPQKPLINVALYEKRVVFILVARSLVGNVVEGVKPLCVKAMVECSNLTLYSDGKEVNGNFHA